MPALYVFIGPSIDRSTAQQLVPRAQLLPPIASGDLLRLHAGAGDTVAIIDGYFRQKPSVRHKEILACLAQGVRVVGASSMGALRAAELQVFGMEGYGEIFRQYAAGEIDGDDEVALLHLPEEEGNRPITEALVNVRYNLQSVARRGLIPAETNAAVLTIAKNMPFVERTWERILRLATAAGLPAHELAALRTYLADHYVDRKRQDALELLQGLRDGLPTTAPREPLHVAPTRWLVQWQRRATGSYLPDGTFVSAPDVLAMFQLGSAHYPAFYRRVTLLAVASLQARAVGLAAPPPEALLTTFRAQRGLRTDADYQAFLRQHYLAEDELVSHLELLALAQAALAQTTPAAAWRAAHLEQIFLQHLVQRGLLETTHALPPAWSAWVSPAERAALPVRRLLVRAALRGLYLGGLLRWTEPLVTALKLGGHFPDGLNRWAEMARLSHEFQVANPDMDLEALDLSGLRTWYGQRWDSTEPFELQLYDRGFHSVQDFRRLAGPYYLYDRDQPARMLVRLALPPLRRRTVAPTARKAASASHLAAQG